MHPDLYDLLGWWKNAVRHPIFVLLSILGAIHAVEVTQRVTLSLLRDVRRTLGRIASHSRKHQRELRAILRMLTGRRRTGRRPPGS